MCNVRAFLCLTGMSLTLPLAGCCLECNSSPEAEAAIRPVLAGLTVEVRPGTGAYSIRGAYSVIIRFHNAGPDTVSILKPLDGSTTCRHMPYYRFTVWNADRQPLKPEVGCGHSGLWWNTRWPEDYLVEIKPEASFEVELPLPCEVERDGPYTIAFEYVYQPTKEQFTPPPGAWRGSVKAAEVVLNLKRE